LACKNSFLLRDDLFIIPSLKSCLRNQLTSINYFNQLDRSPARNDLTPAEYWNEAV
jgi:hypothetical protein